MARGALILSGAIFVQAVLGILTLIHQVPIDIALSHQAMALGVLTAALFHAERIVSRVLAHQERMEMIRRGFMPPPDPRMARQAARMGWQQPPGPVPPPFSTVPPPGDFYDPNYYAQAQMRKGITVTLVGFALLIGLSFIGVRGDTFTGGPWLLGGLIPMFLIIGVWGGKRRVYAAFKFFLYTLAGSLLMLVAIMYMYWTARTSDIEVLMHAGFSPQSQF